MVRFAHISDVHLGGWKQPEMQELNFKSFQTTIETCIKLKLEFVIIAGDLFDTAYPGIEVLKQTFAEFRKLKEARIPCFIIAGSHDYSVSGKTFLDVLEKAGFCQNVTSFDPDLAKSEEKEEQIILHPTLYKGVAIYGYHGKKSSLEIPDLRKIKLDDAPGLIKILMIHSTLDKAKGSLPIDAIEADLLPKADYYALGHLHIDFQYENFVYPGPLFPNNFQELEDLNYGSFYIVDINENLKPNLEKVSLKLKETCPIAIEITDGLTANQKILDKLDSEDLHDKIVLLRVSGILEKGRTSDIKFQELKEYAMKKGAYFLLKNTHDLKTKETELNLSDEEHSSEEIEEKTIQAYSQDNPSEFNSLIPQLINAFSVEKQEGEKNNVFESRLLDSAKKVLQF